MASKLPHSLRAELEWAVGLMMEHGQPSPSNLDMIHRCVRVPTPPLLAKRFQIFVDNSAPFSEMGRENATRLGALMLALEAWGAGKGFRLYQPGEWDSSPEGAKATQIQFRCTESWKARLRAYCERSGSDLSSLIRRAVEAHLEWNPLWKGLSPEGEAEE